MIIKNLLQASRETVPRFSRLLLPGLSTDFQHLVWRNKGIGEDWGAQLGEDPCAASLQQQDISVAPSAFP